MGRPAVTWVPEKIERLRALLADGFDSGTIASHMGVTIESVRRAVTRYKLRRNAGSRRGRKHTDETIDRVLALRKQGLSASAIAGQMGLSRNAVVGIWHRSAPADRTHVARRRNFPTPPRVFHPSASLPGDRLHDSAAFRGTPRVAGVRDLERHHCRWPIERGFCGCRKVAGTSYCNDHLILSRANS